MIIEKPKWVNHGGHAIFSIDIHPDATRFATAGGDNVIRIWNLEAIKSSEELLPPNTPQRLASLCDHFGPVNCVRWSHNGRYLASGSDDKLVMLHEKHPGGGVVEFGCTEQTNIENWKVVNTLRGHTSDVVDLAWSPCDSKIASCSLDNTIKVFDVTVGILITTLSAHTSLVKGVSWDPIGSFIASQSDDKSVIIWKTSDWSKRVQVTGPYSKSVGATFFRRLDWSPCGSFLTTPHAFQTPQHTAAVIERSDWSKAYDFVGHVAPVVAIRYCDAMFRKPKHKKNRKECKKTEKSIMEESDNGVKEHEKEKEKGKEMEKENKKDGKQVSSAISHGIESESNFKSITKDHDKSCDKVDDKTMDVNIGMEKLGRTNSLEESKSNHGDGKKQRNDNNVVDNLNRNMQVLNEIKEDSKPNFEPNSEPNSVPNSEPNSLPYHCLALGSQDYQLTVWMTSRFQPLVVVKNLFIQPVIDLSWSRDGKILLCCSSDGSMAALLFESNEIGNPLSMQEIKRIKKEKYGDFQARDFVIPESPALMNFQLTSTVFEKPKESQKVKDLESIGLQKDSMIGIDPRQHECTQPSMDESESSLSVMGDQVEKTIDRKKKELINVEKSNLVGLDSSAKLPGNSSLNPSNTRTLLLESMDTKKEERKGNLNTKKEQVEVRSADGRRRIIPVPINPPSTKLPVLSSDLPVVTQKSMGIGIDAERKENEKVSGKRLHSTMDAYESMVKEGKNGETEAKKSKVWNEKDGEEGEGEEHIEKRKLINEREKNHLTLEMEGGGQEWGGMRRKDKVYFVEGKDKVYKEGKSMVEVHDKKKVLFVEVKKKELGEFEYSWVLQTANYDNSKEAANHILCFRDSKLIWEDYLEEDVTCLAGNVNFFAAASKNGLLQVYTPYGRRALPPIVCQSPVCMMTCSEDDDGDGDDDFHLLILTYGGDLLMWHLGDGENVLDESISPLISFMGKNYDCPLRVHSIHITKKNEPLLFLDDGNSFVFHGAYNAWIRCTEFGFPCSSFSSFWPGEALKNQKKNEKNFVQRQQTLQRAAQKDQNYFSKNKSFLLRKDNFESHSRAYLEEKLCACEMFGMAEEYKKYLVLYVRHLTREGEEFKLRELCEEFLGPIHLKNVEEKKSEKGKEKEKVEEEKNEMESMYAILESEKVDDGKEKNAQKEKFVYEKERDRKKEKRKEEWNPLMMGFNKREVLRNEILPCMVSNRSLHRLLNEFLHLLNIITA